MKADSAAPPPYSRASWYRLINSGLKSRRLRALRCLTRGFSFTAKSTSYGALASCFLLAAFRHLLRFVAAVTDQIRIAREPKLSHGRHLLRADGLLAAMQLGGNLTHLVARPEQSHDFRFPHTQLTRSFRGFLILEQGRDGGRQVLPAGIGGMHSGDDMRHGIGLT